MKRVLWAILVGFSWLVGGTFTQAAPQADFSFSPENPDINTEVIFDAGLSRSSEGRILRYEWDFDADGQFEESLESPSLSHLFDESGSWTITLRVRDERGQQATITKAISVRSAAVRVRRQITAPIFPNRVPAGSAFQVTVMIKAFQAINGLGLDEDLPEGWRVSSVESSRAVFKGSEAQWLWFQTINPGETVKVIYNVTVPAGTPAGAFKIKGIVSSFSPRFEISIPGDREVQVI